MSSPEHVFALRRFSFTITEHDPSNPWLVVGELRRESVKLEDGQDFYE